MLDVELTVGACRGEIERIALRDESGKLRVTVCFHGRFSSARAWAAREPFGSCSRFTHVKRRHLRCPACRASFLVQEVRRSGIA
jgi:hypothetical protein